MLAHSADPGSEVDDAEPRPPDFVSFPGKLRTPTLSPRCIGRPDLVDRLRAGPPLVFVVAPAGFGKTTLLAQWAAVDERPLAWVSVSKADNDPGRLLSYLALAFDSVEPLARDTIAGLAMSNADLTSIRLPRLAQVADQLSRPHVMVLDDVHELDSPGAVAVLQVLAAHVRPGSQLVLASRADPPPAVARAHATSDVLRLDAQELAMTPAEGTALLRAAGASVDDRAEESLVERTEGWPAGLYLAALAVRERGTAAVSEFSGDDLFIADYFRAEVLEPLPDQLSTFLIRTSILHRLTAPLCDELLDRRDSAAVLAELARTNLFVVALDRRGEWYRYHELFLEMLRWELHRCEPDLAPVLHQRASQWYETQPDFERAIDHARAAGDLERVASLVWTAAPPHIAQGRAATVAAWVGALTDDEMAAYPPLALTHAWYSLATGDTAAVDHWAAVAERGGQDPPDDASRATVPLLRALVGTKGLARMRDDAALAFALDHAGSLFRPVACYLEGSALRLLGEPVPARTRFEEGVRLAGAVNPPVHALCRSGLALLAAEDGDWEAVELQSSRARHVVDEFGLGERPAQAAVFALRALALSRRGATAEARAEFKHGLWLLEMLVDMGPWYVAETNLLLARTALLFGDVATVRMLTREARRSLAQVEDAGLLPERIQQMQRASEAGTQGGALVSIPLTPAEMRVLRYLPTHLSFESIANELFVSRNTVKTQSIAVYRKLGVSSRAEAVRRAREVSLLDP